MSWLHGGCRDPFGCNFDQSLIDEATAVLGCSFDQSLIDEATAVLGCNFDQSLIDEATAVLCTVCVVNNHGAPW
jgi:hypothetical protein